MHRSGLAGFIIDCQTEDQEAEARRLEPLGAKRVAFVKRWIVMQAPTGQRLCIVRPQSKDFATASIVWD